MIPEQQIFEFQAPDGKYYTVRRLTEIKDKSDLHLNPSDTKASNGVFPDRDVVKWFPHGRGSEDHWGKMNLTGVEAGTVIATLFHANTANIFAVSKKAVPSPDSKIQSQFSECGPAQPVPPGMLLALRAAQALWQAQP